MRGSCVQIAEWESIFGGLEEISPGPRARRATISFLPLIVFHLVTACPASSVLRSVSPFGSFGGRSSRDGVTFPAMTTSVKASSAGCARICCASPLYSRSPVPRNTHACSTFLAFGGLAVRWCRNPLTRGSSMIARPGQSVRWISACMIDRLFASRERAWPVS